MISSIFRVHLSFNGRHLWKYWFLCESSSNRKTLLMLFHHHFLGLIPYLYSFYLGNVLEVQNYTCLFGSLSLLSLLKSNIYRLSCNYECRQNKALDHLDVDIEELNSRVKGANQRGRRLLGK